MTQTMTIQIWIPKDGFKHLSPLKVPTNQQGDNGIILVRGPNGERPMARKALYTFYELEEQPLPEAA